MKRTVFFALSTQTYVPESKMAAAGSLMITRDWILVTSVHGLGNRNHISEHCAMSCMLVCNGVYILIQVITQYDSPVDELFVLTGVTF